jgi:SNF2 family DNA or RNA helicase
VQSEDAPLAGERAQAILKPILLRRTKYARLEGKPLLELPAKHIEIVRLKFTPEEREVSLLIYLTSRNGFDSDM